jgi:hypothetical protein
MGRFMKLHYLFDLHPGTRFVVHNKQSVCKANGSPPGEETESVTPNGKMSARSALIIGNTFLVTNVLDLTEGAEQESMSIRPFVTT